jgi:hypothetical protein
VQRNALVVVSLVMPLHHGHRFLPSTAGASRLGAIDRERAVTRCVAGGTPTQSGRVLRCRPRSARVELAHEPHLAIPYVRHGLVGLYTAAVELLARNVTVCIVKTESFDPGRLLVLRIDWE